MIKGKRQEYYIESLKLHLKGAEHSLKVAQDSIDNAKRDVAISEEVVLLAKKRLQEALKGTD